MTLVAMDLHEYLGPHQIDKNTSLINGHLFTMWSVVGTQKRHVEGTSVLSICMSAAGRQTLVNNPLDLENVSVNPIKYVSAETIPQCARYHA